MNDVDALFLEIKGKREKYLFVSFLWNMQSLNLVLNTYSDSIKKKKIKK